MQTAPFRITRARGGSLRRREAPGLGLAAFVLLAVSAIGQGAGAARPRPAHTLAGHRKVVRHLAFNPDASLLASVSADRTVRIWALPGGKAVRLFDFNDTGFEVHALAFGPDGRLALSGSNSDKVGVWTKPPGEVSVWDVRTGKRLFVRNRHACDIGRVAFSSDGRLLATASAQASKVWDATTGRLVSEQEVGAFSRPLLFSPDGARLAVVSRHLGTEKVFIRDTATGEGIAVLADFTGSVRHLRFSPDGRSLTTFEDDARVVRWPLGKGGRVWVERSPLGPFQVRVGPDAWAPEGGRRVTVADDGRLVLWDRPTGKALATLLPQGGLDSREDAAVALSPDGRWLATSLCQHDIEVWSVPDLLK